MCYSELPLEFPVVSRLRSTGPVPSLADQSQHAVRQLMNRFSMPAELLDATQQGSFTFQNTAVRVMDAGQSERVS